MDIFNVLTMIGGLCLFLFGMNLMGQALERRAGGKLQSLLDKMTGSVPAGFLTGLGITAIIQSSSATTVMVVGFVNSGLMTLRHHRHGVAVEPCGHQRQQYVGESFKAVILHACFGAHRYHFLYVLQVR